MTRRHHRRAAVIAIALFTALVPLTLVTASPAQAASIAGYGKVVASSGLPMRTGPSTGYPVVARIPDGGNVGIMCRVLGRPLKGTVRYSGLWDRLTNGAYVADAYIARGNFRIPVCEDTDEWMPPVYAPVSSDFRSGHRPKHDGIDLAAARYTPIRAAAAGEVVRVRCNVSAGSCDVDGSRSVRGCGWYAEVLHANKAVTRYCHMFRRPSVEVGQKVAKGQVLGYVGSSGGSSGPHLHFEVHYGSPTRENAINPVWFMYRQGHYFG